ncbi:CLUMA_CG011399, isoform A [Clunio marinus]|uniref:CLUMA_CG011399, isoform A n=1 Tax=Clunio marinus TaxID=568069 RepID=A0A1J1IG62_9DIPT|nr:CLUMA_CG011399, isoform A [Clunio marinus]
MVVASKISTTYFTLCNKNSSGAATIYSRKYLTNENILFQDKRIRKMFKMSFSFVRRTLTTKPHSNFTMSRRWFLGCQQENKS